MKRPARSGRPLSVILLDVDHFKIYNDTYGHLTGDDCLRSIASAVQICVRRPDYVVARFGGEELAVLLPGSTPDGAEEIAQRLCVAVMDMKISHPGNDGRGIVTMSGGISTAIASQDGKVRMPQGLLKRLIQRSTKPRGSAGTRWPLPYCSKPWANTCAA